MTRQPQDFDSLPNPSTLWGVDWGGDRIVFEFFGGGIGIRCDRMDGTLEFEQVSDLAEQLNAWLEWKRGCPHKKFVRTDRCGEMSCWNYASRRPVDAAEG